MSSPTPLPSNPPATAPPTIAPATAPTGPPTAPAAAPAAAPPRAAPTPVSTGCEPGASVIGSGFRAPVGGTSTDFSLLFLCAITLTPSPSHADPPTPAARHYGDSCNGCAKGRENPGG